MSSFQSADDLIGSDSSTNMTTTVLDRVAARIVANATAESENADSTYDIDRTFGYSLVSVRGTY